MEVVKKDNVDFKALVNGSKNLSVEFQSKMIEILQEEFTDEEEQWYMANFYVYLNYHPTDDYPIDLGNVFKLIGFAHKGNAKRTLDKNFEEGKDFIVQLLRKDKQQHGIGGAGLNEEKIMLNVETFKDLCMVARTEKGKKIRKYYRKLETLFNKLIDEERKESKKKIKELEYKIEDMESDKEKLLIKKFTGKRCVYIGKIVIEDGFVIKVGSTEDIPKRYNKHGVVYGNFKLLDIFESEHFRDIESDILQDPVIKRNLYRDKINGHLSIECVKLSDNFNYNQYIDIVKKYLYKTRGYTTQQLLEKQKLDIENKRLEYDFICRMFNNPMYENIIKSKIEQIEFNFKHIDDLEVKNDLPQEDLNSSKNDKIFIPKKPRGRKIQKIDPNNLNVIVAVYDSMIYALNDPENKNISKKSIMNSSKNNTVVKGYRWKFVENHEDPSICKIEPTKISKIKPAVRETIVVLNKYKTKILGSFPSKKSLQDYLMVCKKKTRSIVDNQQLHDDKYYIKISDCPQELIDNYSESVH